MACPSFHRLAPIGGCLLILAAVPATVLGVPPQDPLRAPAASRPPAIAASPLPQAPAGTTNTAAPAPSLTPDAEDMKEASEAYATGQWELALIDVDAAIRSNPKNADAYMLRASFYVGRKLWDRATADYLAAQKIAPSTLISYDLAEVLFMNRAYEEARPKFAALETDPKYRDLGFYKAYLCDLLSRHERAALDDLSEIDQHQDSPAYYFSHAVWDLYQGNRREGTDWLHKASVVVGPQMFQFYMLSLSESALVSPANMTFTTKDGTAYKDVLGFVEENGLRVSTNTGWQTIPFNNLPDDLSALPQDIQQDIRANKIANGGLLPPDVVTFTTKDGRTFTQARVTDEDDGLLVETRRGTAVVPYDQMPSPMVGFPPALKARVAARLHFESGQHSLWTPVSFTTRNGTHYDHVRAMVNGEGVNLVTDEGWVTLPFSELRHDLSEFPPQMRDQIVQESTQRIDDPGDLKAGENYLQARVSFTTTKGKSYAEVKYCVTDDGVTVLTPDGWVLVGFDELPGDLSGFPGKAKVLIQARAAEYQEHQRRRKAAQSQGDAP